VILVQHASDDTLERIAMQTLPGSDVGPLEEHLLVCDECRDRLDAEMEFARAMRGAAAKVRHQEYS
jgi:predicted anti-sigma-YlaC factor YlaD